MKRHTLRLLGLAALALLAAFPVWAATIDVSTARNITNTGGSGGNGYYERDPELLMGSSGTWFLIYSRSQTSFAPAGNPDGLKYDTYCQTSADNGASWSVAAKILDAAAISAGASFRSATVCEADGKVWVMGANVESLEGDVYANTYAGGAWSGQARIFDGTYNTGAFHIDAIAEGDDIRLFYGIQNELNGIGFILYHGDTDTWDATVTQIGTSAGGQIPRVIKEGSTYYLVSTDWAHILFTSTTTPDNVPWPAAVAITDAPTDGASSDPCILRYGAGGGSDDLLVFHAPWYSDDSQPEEYLYSEDAGSTWTSSRAFTDGSHGTQRSWDMMPRAYMKDATTAMVFFGMEQRGVSRGQADIVMVAWDLSATVGHAHYTTIQDGIDNAASGDRIDVGPGNYAERLTISRPLDLRGAQYGVDPTLTGARTDPSAESTIDITGLGVANPNVAVEIPAGVTDVFLSGFTVIGSPTYHYADESAIRCWDDRIAIQDNIISGYVGVLYKGNDYFGVERNRLTVNKTGVTVQPSAASYVTIAGNLMTRGTSPAGDESAAYLTATSYSRFTGNTATGFLTGRALHGSGVSHLDVSENTLTGNRDGISIFGGSTFITVADNVLSSNTRYGINIKGQDIVIRENQIASNAQGGIFVDVHVIATERVQIAGNSIVGNTPYGLQVTGNVTQTVDASGNWWGDATPAGVRAKVTGAADYTPWLASGTDTGDPGFQGDFSTLWVDDDSPQAGTTSRIQEGVNLVTGSTVYIAPGTYPGTVVFGDATPDGIVLQGGDPGDRPVLSDGVRFANATDPLDGVTLRDLILRGDGDSNGTVQAILSCENGAALYDLRLVTCQIDGEGVAVGADGESGRHGFSGNLMGSTIAVIGCEFVDIPGWSVFDTDASSDYSPWGGNGLPLTSVAFAGNTVHDCNGTVSLRGHTPTRTALVEVYDNVFDNIGGNFSQTGMQWAACEINHAVEARVYDNLVRDTALGIYGEGQAFQLWDVGDLDMHDNAIVDNAQGVFIFGGGVGHAYGGPWPVPTGAITHNSISGNSAYGVSVDANASGGPLDARGNWWGAASGPYHPTLNPFGGGNAVSDNVLFDPFLAGNIVFIPDPEYFTATGSKTVTVRYLGGASGLLYSWQIRMYDWDGGVVDAAAVDVSKGDTDWGIFIPQNTGTADEVTVTGSLVGNDPGTTGPCDLFRVTFHGVSQGEEYPKLEVKYFRDRNFNNLTGTAPDAGDLIVVGPPPAVSVVALTNVTLTGITNDYCKNGDLLGLTATVQPSGDPLFGIANITANLTALGGGAAVHPTDWDDVSGLATWADFTVVWATEEEDEKGVMITATDGAGQIGTGSDTIILDNVKPEPVTDLTAAPGHKKVTLAWANGTDTYYAGVKIVYNPWTNYPRYGSGGSPGAPDYPLTPGDTDVAYEAAGTGTVWSYVPRDIYYFSAYAYDMARNYAEAASTARATNYWLGDVRFEAGHESPYDGEVYTADISALGASYYAEPLADYECDVAQLANPNDPRGIPAPDGHVDFEDLMIFALNFGVVTPTLLTVPPIAVPDGPRDGEVAFSIELPEAMSPGSEFEARVMLSDADGVVQGARFVVTYDANVVEYLGSQPGALVQGIQSSFFMPVLVEGQPDISAAALGEGVTFGHSGELAKVRFRVVGEGTISLGLRDIQARNVLNEELLASSSDVVEGPGEVKLPTEVFLHSAQPNPFGGATTLSYGLPEAAPVKLAVYDVSGRLVRVLAEGQQSAGEHPVLWDGRDEAGSRVATGLYLYRLETQVRTITKKLIVTE